MFAVLVTNAFARTGTAKPRVWCEQYTFQTLAAGHFETLKGQEGDQQGDEGAE